MSDNYVPRLKQKYADVIVPALQEKFNYSNVMQLPKVQKVILNMGVGGAVANSKKITNALSELECIAGQKPVATRARKSIAGFKLREGMRIGAKVTLRRDRMWDFIDRLTTIALPRVRDFRGLHTRSFDGNGNFSLGIREHIVFPEVNYDQVEDIHGLDITVCTSAKTDEEAALLLKHCGFPFRNLLA